MKRASGSSHKKARRVLSSSSNESPRPTRELAAGPSSSEDEKILQKRARVIQQRRSVIQIEKKANTEGSSAGGEKENMMKKRKSKEAGLTSGVSSGGDVSPDENFNKPKIVRRRLSKKFRLSHNSNNNSSGRLNSFTGRPSVVSLGNLSDASAFGAKKDPTDRKTLRDIYATCSALFQAHKITPQNAFSLKLVECLDEIIESDDFDRRNLPLLARTIEIGGKIYVCRVDCTHANTIKLVNEITLNRNKQDPSLGEGHQDQAAQPETSLQDIPDADERNKKFGAKRKKRSRFIEENESKLNTGFEDQTAKYFLRRTDLKSKFHRNVEEELDFDYTSYFLKPGEANPFKTEREREALGSEAHIPDSHDNPDEMMTVPWLPFRALTEWDPKKFDLWGEPLANLDPFNTSEIQRPMSPITVSEENEFAYNPENRPDEYPGAENDSLGAFDNDFPDHFEEEKPLAQADGSIERPLPLDQLRSLDDLQKFFGQLQRNELQMNQKYGWAGPVFLKPQRVPVVKTKVKKAKKKRPVLMLDFDEVDWKDKANRYQVAKSGQTTLDDKTLEKWRKAKTTHPFSSSVNFMGFEEDEEEFRAPFGSNLAFDDPLANITRFFVDANRDIFQLMAEEFRAGRNLNGGEEAESLGNEPFSSREWSPGDEMDLEVARDYPEEERPLEVEQAGELADDLAGLDLSAMFPGSLATGTSFTGTSEFDAIRFSRRPKPIDMHALKDLIRKILQENLKLDEEGKPSVPVETRMDLKALISELMKRADGRMAKHLSVAIIVVGLMHVVAEKKLFMEGGGDNPSVVCKGSQWRHKDNIPLASIQPME